MSNGQQAQIDSLKQAIAELEVTIAQRNALLQQPLSPEDRRAIDESIQSLQAERARLQAQLTQLEAAAVEVQGLGQTPPNADPNQD